MQSGPNTDKTFQVQGEGAGWGSSRFSDFRQKSLDSLRERNLKTKPKRKIIGKPETKPEYIPGDIVIISSDSKNARCYKLVEIIDVDYSCTYKVSYYGIILKVTDGKDIEGIGRICSFDESGHSWSAGTIVKGIKEENIKWKENENEIFSGNVENGG